MRASILLRVSCISKKLRVILALLLITLLIAPASYADFKDAYKDGVRAAESQNWTLVESKMREALRAEPTPQAKVRLYGMRFEPYIPHHYLALAASAKNDCAAAMAALNNSAHQSALSGARDATQLVAVEQQIIRRCQAAAPAIPPTLPVLPSNTTPPANPLPDVKPPVTVQTPPTPQSTEPKLASTEVARVRSAVQLLKRELSAARSTFAKPELAAAANAKSAELNALDQEAARLSLDLDRAIGKADAVLLSNTGSAANAASARATALKLAANSALAASTPVARQPAPPALAQMAKSYFGGDFKAAAQADVESLQGKALAHALLLRAAARYSLYVAQGESKTKQLDLVKADLARAKSVDAAVRPSAQFFSPRLIQLYQ